LNVNWYFNSPVGTTMTIKCDQIHIEDHPSCGYDAFILSPSGSTTFSDGLLFCGRGIVSPRSSTSNRLSVRLTTDSSNPTSIYKYLFTCQVTASGFAQPTTTVAPVPYVPSDPATCKCGQRNSGNRIVGGTNALLNEFPWRIGMKNSLNGGVFCGGSIISPNYIMTAAHCTAGIAPGAIVYVTVGDHDISTTRETASQNVKVVEIKQHKSYNSKNIDNDISLLRLETPLTFSDKIMPVCLPFNYINTSFEGQMIMAGGWGTLTQGGQQPTILQKVEIPFMSTAECRNYYGTSITDNMICTYKPGQDTCQGDSGGSVEARTPNSFYTAIGVVSWGKGCAQENGPGVYAKVTNYLTWIKENTNGESFCEK
jgi:V8-like Glu-specific endopeptidase